MMLPSVPALVRRALLPALLIGVGATSSLASAAPAADSLDLARHRGHVVIVDFWASWCKPCRQSIPWLNALQQRYGAEGLTVIGVNVDAERRDADRFLRDVPIDFELVYDPTGSIAERFKLQGMPSSYVFDRSGTLVEARLGFRTAKQDEHEASIRKLLGQAAR